jgi:hypothetical protein
MKKPGKYQLEQKVAVMFDRIGLMTVLLEHANSDQSDSEKLETIRRFAQGWLHTGERELKAAKHAQQYHGYE